MIKLLYLIGGSRGLGRALLDLYVQNGWEVLEFSRSGSPPWNHPLDMIHPQRCLSAFREHLQTHPDQEIERVVLILNSAVILPIRKVAGLLEEEILQSVNVNVTSAILLCQNFVRRFRNLPRPKALVNIGSGAAHRGFPGWSLYCAGKAAMESFFRALYEEEKTEAHPFSVLNYDPHVMDTQMQQEIRQASPEDFPLVERFRKMHADGVLTAPERVAAHLFRIVDRFPSERERFGFGE